MDYKANAARCKRHYFGTRYEEASLADIRIVKKEGEKILDWIKDIDWARPRSPFLVLKGATQSGKTHMAAALYEWLYSHPLMESQDIKYLQELDFMKYVRSSIPEKIEDYLTVAKFQVNHRCVIYDDLGLAKNTEWNQEVIAYSIDHLRRNFVITVITTDFDKAGLKERLGARVAARVYSRENVLVDLEQIDVK